MLALLVAQNIAFYIIAALMVVGALRSTLPQQVMSKCDLIYFNR